MIIENLKTITEKIKASARKTNRHPEDITLVAVSKRFPIDTIEEAYNCGQTTFGENYIQELLIKHKALPSNINFHFIGHLQSNKAKTAVKTCSMIETVDSIKLGNLINKHSKNLNKKTRILAQVNIANESSKSGILPPQTGNLLEYLENLEHIEVCGLMTMVPFSVDPEESRPFFRKLHLLAQDMKLDGHFPNINKMELSMGMSNDFEIAIEEGATIIRVGTAIFGQRPIR